MTIIVHDFKAMQRAMWARGNYHRFAQATVWELGALLAEACGIGRGHRVLDVAAGTGNVAIRAAERGAQVTASDLTPEQFVAGREAARAAGVDLEWIEADAESLPFEPDSFDVVTSCFGAIFAPDHERVTSEMLRVCRPGGLVGMINFAPDGAALDFFSTLGRYAPPPPASPLEWGSEDHVRSLFGGRAQLKMRRGTYTERAASAEAYRQLFKESFGPAVTIYESLPPGEAARLDDDLLQYIGRNNRNERGGNVEIAYDYLLVLARKEQGGQRTP